jgi:hypothetical protein
MARRSSMAGNLRRPSRAAGEVKDLAGSILAGPDRVDRRGQEPGGPVRCGAAEPMDLGVEPPPS